MVGVEVAVGTERLGRRGHGGEGIRHPRTVVAGAAGGYRAAVTNRAALSHPVAWAAAGLLALNDHVLKPWLHDALTGKLSDVAWLALSPLVLAALVAPRSTRLRVVSLLGCGGFFTLLQLWPPLGAWFSPAHVADAADLWTLPALAVPWAVWHAQSRRDWGWFAVPPLLAPLLATTPVAEVQVADVIAPCSASGTWPTGTPLLIQHQGDESVETDAFLSGLHLVGPDGELRVVAVTVENHVTAVCAVDGLAPDTDYTFTLGPWDGLDAAHQLPSDGMFDATVPFHTDADEGAPAPTPDDCRKLVDTSALAPCEPDEADTAADTGPWT